MLVAGTSAVVYPAAELPRVAKRKSIPAIIIEDKDGPIFIMGDEGIEVSMGYIKRGCETILEPTAKEIFDFHIEQINNLIERLPPRDFLLESTVVQMDITMLVSAYEAYFKKRFVELEKEGWVPKVDELLRAISSTLTM